MRIRPRHLTPLLATAVVLATTAAGCGSSGTPSHETVPGNRNETVTCNEQPWAHGAIDPTGTGITVHRGQVIGALYVSCQGGEPDTWFMSVILVRDGQDLPPGTPYTVQPDATGYEASTFVTCVPGTYHVLYRYKWTLQGGVQQNTKTTTDKAVVTAHDCESS